jgi:hypothetical protein
MMDFPTAMRQVIQGDAISRESWDDEGAYCLLENGILVIYNDTGMHSWVISISDMNGEDWIIYE